VSQYYSVHQVLCWCTSTTSVPVLLVYQYYQCTSTLMYQYYSCTSLYSCTSTTSVPYSTHITIFLMYQYYSSVLSALFYSTE